jgi:catechol 2,3-dioxygenase-like lactoylglutathione lyase family enzyme
VRFYGELGLPAKMTGDEVAFFDAGGVVLALFRWEVLAANAGLPDAPRPQAFRGAALARTCRSDADVDVTLAHALRIGARLLKPARRTSLGGYSGFFADPDGHPWEVAWNPGWTVAADGSIRLGK